MEAVRLEISSVDAVNSGVSAAASVVPFAAPTSAVGASPYLDRETVAARERESDAAFAAAAGRPLPPEILLDGPLSLREAVAIAEGRAAIAIGDVAAAKMRAAHDRLQRCVEEARVVYGVTTGFGPLADRLVSPRDIETLQRNLVYHLASGVGDPMPWAAARATVLARLCSMAQGWSGASEPMVDLMAALLNSPFAPRIPEMGTVGASGDLTPLSHVALSLMAEGGFIDSRGRAVDPLEAFDAMGRTPLTLSARDGLALVNGTAAMTGVAAMNGALAERLIGWSEALTVATAELLNGRDEAWRAEFSEARPHPGQAQAAAALRARADDAARIDHGAASTRRLHPGDHTPSRDERPLQDPYTLRCAPQMLGAVRDVVAFHQSTVARELNAATDNPIFGDGPEIALHGGNFMGCHVAFASDALNNATIFLAAVAERRLARLTDERRNGGLPAFLHRGEAGLNSGFMGAQVTATALLAEMRARGGASSTQTISTNADNQDVVSMGTIAARGASSALRQLSRILAIETLAVAQAVEIVAERDAPCEEQAFSNSTRALVSWTRARSAALREDRPLSSDIETVAVALTAADAPSSNSAS